MFGGSGLLGSHCVRFFSKNFEVNWTYNLPLKNLKKNSLRFIFSENSLELEKIILTTKPDIIINAMGLVSVDDCEKNQFLAYNLNTKFVKNLIDTLTKLELDSTYFIQISSGGVYGNRINCEESPWEENDVLNPLSIYGKSKAYSETETQKYNGPFLIIRSDFYGLNNLRERRTLLSWIIHDALNNIQMEGWENILFSPISAEQLCTIIEKAIFKNLNGIFNVGSDQGCNKFDFVDTVCNILQLKPKLHRNTAESIIRPRYSVLSSNKIKKYIDFNCEWKSELENYLKKYYKFK